MALRKRRSEKECSSSPKKLRLKQGTKDVITTEADTGNGTYDEPARDPVELLCPGSILGECLMLHGFKAPPGSRPKPKSVELHEAVTDSGTDDDGDDVSFVSSHSEEENVQPRDGHTLNMAIDGDTGESCRRRRAAWGEMRQCSECDYVTKVPNNLKRHSSAFHSRLEKPEQCCSKLFWTKYEHSCHRNEVHKRDATKVSYLCPFEDCFQGKKNFFRRSLLENHLAFVHGGEAPYKCWSCDYETQHKGNLNNHLKRVHPPPDYPAGENDVDTARISEPVHVGEVRDNDDSFEESSNLDESEQVLLIDDDPLSVGDDMETELDAKDELAT